VDDGRAEGFMEISKSSGYIMSDVDFAIKGERRRPFEEMGKVLVH
jgi:hypothetical protein